jgi:hypothetical protein
MEIARPIAVIEIDRHRDIRIPTLRGQEEQLPPSGGCLDGVAEVTQEDDVAIAVAKIVVACDSLSPPKDMIEIFHAAFMSFDMRFVPQAKFSAGLGGSLLVAEENDFHIRVQQLPAHERVALDDAYMAAKRFGG